jgi:hypothetical protein
MEHRELTDKEIKQILAEFKRIIDTKGSVPVFKTIYSKYGEYISHTSIKNLQVLMLRNKRYRKFKAYEVNADDDYIGLDNDYDFIKSHPRLDLIVTTGIKYAIPLIIGLIIGALSSALTPLGELLKKMLT